MAGAEHRVRVAVADRLGGAHERGVLHPAHAGRGVGVHGDDLGRLDDLETTGVAQFVGPSDQHHGDAELAGHLGRGHRAHVRHAQVQHVHPSCGEQHPPDAAAGRDAV